MSIITIPYNSNTLHVFAQCFKNCVSREGIATDCFVFTGCSRKDSKWYDYQCLRLNNMFPYSTWTYDIGTEPILIQNRK
jgi:hypothetical protein